MKTVLKEKGRPDWAVLSRGFSYRSTVSATLNETSARGT